MNSMDTKLKFMLSSFGVANARVDEVGGVTFVTLYRVHSTSVLYNEQMKEFESAKEASRHVEELLAENHIMDIRVRQIMRRTSDWKEAAQ